MDGDRVRAWFADPIAVSHYARAVSAVGLWRSEKAVFSAVFRQDQRLLEVGCGTGRVAFGLFALEFEDVVGVDFCPPMVEEARRIAKARQCPLRFVVGDATKLPFDDGSFDGAIFAFNGLMQIPGRKNRRRALLEIRRVVRPGARLVFTTHDFDQVFRSKEATEELERTRCAIGCEEGDRVLTLAEGRVFIHIPCRDEILEDLQRSGWELLEDHARASVANEPAEVRDFSDECRFWLARRVD